jgi:hypothetical protein
LVIRQFRGSAELVDDATEQHRLAFARVALDPKDLAIVVVAPTLKLRMAEDPLVGLLEGGPPCLVDGRLDVTWVGLGEVVEAAIPALSILVLGYPRQIWDFRGAGLDSDVPSTYMLNVLGW